MLSHGSQCVHSTESWPQQRPRPPFTHPGGKCLWGEFQPCCASRERWRGAGPCPGSCRSAGRAQEAKHLSRCPRDSWSSQNLLSIPRGKQTASSSLKIAAQGIRTHPREGEVRREQVCSFPWSSPQPGRGTAQPSTRTCPSFRGKAALPLPTLAAPLGYTEASLCSSWLPFCQGVTLSSAGWLGLGTSQHRCCCCPDAPSGSCWAPVLCPGAARASVKQCFQSAREHFCRPSISHGDTTHRGTQLPAELPSLWRGDLLPIKISRGISKRGGLSGEVPLPGEVPAVGVSQASLQGSALFSPSCFAISCVNCSLCSRSTFTRPLGTRGPGRAIARSPGQRHPRHGDGTVPPGARSAGSPGVRFGSVSKHLALHNQTQALPAGPRPEEPVEPVGAQCATGAAHPAPCTARLPQQDGSRARAACPI